MYHKPSIVSSIDTNLLWLTAMSLNIRVGCDVAKLLSVLISTRLNNRKGGILK